MRLRRRSPRYAAPEGAAIVGGVRHGLRNPLLDADCPDPCVVRSKDEWLLVATTYFEDAEDKLPLYMTRDFVRWEARGHVFPRGSTPAWADGQFWAPEIHRAFGSWRCYFTARERGRRLAIGVAVAEDPWGPWRDSGAPILRGETTGVIDAHLFFDDDDERAFLYWKVDGNDLRPLAPTPIHVQELAADGITRVGPERIAITNDLAWEAHVVEAPWAVRHAGRVFLFYSGNAFHTAEYAMGVARARSPLGSYEKLAAPILTSGARWRGPGHACVIRVADEDFLVHHAWDGDRIFGRHPRLAVAARLEWRSGWPSVIPIEDARTIG